MQKNKSNPIWASAKTMVTCLTFASFSLTAQIDETLYPVSAFDNLNNSNQRSSANSKTIQLPLEKGILTSAAINYSNTSNNTETIIGNVDGKSENTFSLKIEKGNITGQAVLLDQNKAYKYITQNGKNFVQEVDINEILCVSFDKDKNKPAETKEAVASAGSPAYNLESKPGAAGCVYIDFDGEYVSGTYWNSGNPIDAAASGFSDAKITEVWEIASEDFRPFDINITTNVDVFNSYPKNRRMHTIVTSTTTAAPGSGGVAYIGSFNWNDDTPCWVFNLGTKACGETVSHEVGHTFDVLHDGTSSVTYYSGQGDWAPIMGASFYDPITHWSIGDYTDANRFQDDVALISGTKFGVGYRTDAHGNSTTTATALQVNADGSVDASSNNGIIETRVDLDFFSFTTTGGNVELNFETVARHGNLDILAKLYNSSGTVIGTYNPAGLTASLNENLAAGSYFISIDGTGSGSPLATGYSDYGSIGSFFISGNIPVGGVSNIAPTVTITSPNNGDDQTTPATFNIIASANDVDGTITKVEFFVDGIKVGQSNTAPYTYNYSQSTVGSYNITAVATDNNGATTTSSVVGVSVSSDNGNTCTAPAWSATQSYSGGAQVSYNNVVYEAKWWTLNNQPDLFSNSYDMWKVIGPCQGNINISPTVSIDNPTNGDVFVTGDIIAISASANDADGSITQVEFFVNGSSIGTDVSAPYTFNWTSIVGGHNITAEATDNEGATSTSSIVGITVHDPIANELPTVSITNPTEGAVYTTGDVLTIAADATDNDGSVTKVEFYVDGILIGTDLLAAYNLNWTSTVGSHTVYAVATDDDGGTTTSTIINITVNDPVGNQLPTVVLTNPTDGAVITKGDVLTISANASDADGTIATVEFFINGTLIGGDISAPYSITYNADYVGSYSVFAIATDNEGGVTTSVYNAITVEEPSTCTTPAWNSSTAYSGGAQVSYSGNLYQAKWWTLNNQPDLFSGPYDMWALIGACGGVAEIKVLNNVSEIRDEFSVAIYPNPTSGMITLSISAEKRANVLVSISNLNGAIVNSLNFKQQNAIKEVVDLSNLTNGIYFVNTTINGNTSTQKLVVTH